MCWACDHPDRTRADYLENVRNVIARCGWAVQGVERYRIHPPWAYTVGLTLARKPELVVTGLPLIQATELLNGVAVHLLHAPVPGLGEQVEMETGQVIQIIEVAEPTAHLEIAVELFGPRIQALQVVHADDRGRWPWEIGYQGLRGGQPVLGLPAPPPLIPSATPVFASHRHHHHAEQRTVTRRSSQRQRTRRSRRRSTRPPSR